jgi:alpha-1,6-mannosyltransferase
VRVAPSRSIGGAPWEAGSAGAARRAELHLLDTTMLYAPNSGGVARYLREKRAWLARHTSMRHTLIVPSLRDGVGPHGEIMIGTRALTRSPYRWPYDAPRWVREIRARAPDLVEAGDPGPLGWIALNAAHRMDVPLVSFCHAEVVRMVEQRLGAFCAYFVQHYARIFYRRCDLVVAPSAYMRDRLAEWGVRHAIVRPLGVDVATFNPSAREHDLRRRLALPRRSRVLIYAGRFAPEKNLDVLLDAFRRLGPRYHLVVAGAGDALPRQSNVTHVPFVESTRDLARLLASADALVHAGDQETFGLILLEAMACGRPVVAPNAGAAPEVVGSDAGILVRPRDPDALAQAVSALYESDRDALGSNARRRVEQHYTWDAAMRGLLGAYRAALSPSPITMPNYAAS